MKPDEPPFPFGPASDVTPHRMAYLEGMVLGLKNRVDHLEAQLAVLVASNEIEAALRPDADEREPF